MGKSLQEIAQQLKASEKKVQLIYAFNGTGKTRLSREFRVAPKNYDEEPDAEESSGVKVVYYNAFTEDLFYWDNDLDHDIEPKLKIQANAFTEWILVEQGQDQNIIANFQRYTDEKLTPRFNQEYIKKDTDGKDAKVKAFSEVTFSFERGNDVRSDTIKISKGEESNFIWCVFYSLLEQIVDVLNVAEPPGRETDQFNQLEYIFIDDPVSSLDENHLIELAVDLAQLIKSSKSEVKFIITTHSPLFYNVLHNEFKKDTFKKYLLNKLENGEYELTQQSNDSPFSYHLFLKKELEKAIDSGKLQKYHYNFLRNVLEKTSTFLGYQQWGELLPKTSDGVVNPYETRIINISSHSKHAGEEVAELTEDDKRVLRYLVTEFSTMYRFYQAEGQRLSDRGGI
ncbi:MAG: anticodon nuclease [Spirochaetes bacterium GWB1_59_5]|nr:MAG: anticodon nuclease [Spirochaetes bacterium GWB1_59_5]